MHIVNYDSILNLQYVAAKAKDTYWDLKWFYDIQTCNVCLYIIGYLYVSNYY